MTEKIWFFPFCVGLPCFWPPYVSAGWLLKDWTPQETVGFSSDPGSLNLLWC